MIKSAIVGCGKIAGGFDTPFSSKIRTHAKAFKAHPDCKLVGVSDSDKLQASDFAKKWKIPFYTVDFENLISSCKPDILSICSPTETHFEIFEYACKNAVPIIWLEKPAANSLKEVEQMIELSEKFNVEVWVNYYRRYDAGFKQIKQTISDLGTIQHVQAIYTKGLIHNGSHLIDLIHWLFGEIIDFEITGEINDNNFYSVSGILKMNDTNINLKALDYKQFELFELDIIGNNGRIKVIDGGQKIRFENIIESKYYPGYQNLNLYKLHDSTYSKFMLAGLMQGISGGNMPGLDNEILIHKAMNKIVPLQYK